jgi:hypothetical protein
MKPQNLIDSRYDDLLPDTLQEMVTDECETIVE